MELYFSPLACSMATRIAFYEAGADAKFTYVDLKNKQVEGGSDFITINPLGQVPVLRSNGELLMENPVVLQYVADQYPNSGLAPKGGIERYRLQQWLSFIASELHKLVFNPLLVRDSPEGAKAFAREKAEQRFAYLNTYLNSRDYLLDRFTVADAYLVTVLNWAKYVDIDLAKWPALRDYFTRLTQRPSIARALSEEGELYLQQQARQKN